MGLTELTPFQADAIDTAKRLEEVAAHIGGRYPGAEAICNRAAKLIVELIQNEARDD